MNFTRGYKTILSTIEHDRHGSIRMRAELTEYRRSAIAAAREAGNLVEGARVYNDSTSQNCITYARMLYTLLMGTNCLDIRSVRWRATDFRQISYYMLCTGSIINAGFTRKDKSIQFKGSVDLVTETDKACEQLIYNALHRAYPSHRFIGEEGSSAQGFTDVLTDEPTWMCDPLDGTTNFVHGYPSCCVSLALAIKKQVVVGVVFCPILDELFVATRGDGATLNGRSISVSRVENLSDALFCTEIGVTRDSDTVQAVFSRISALTQQTRSMRAQGSCALDLCAVACGRVDFMYEIGFGGCWDCAAGSLIVEEAGGEVRDPIGAPFNIMSRRVLAGNKHVTTHAAAVLKDQPQGQSEPPPIPLPDGA